MNNPALGIQYHVSSTVSDRDTSSFSVAWERPGKERDRMRGNGPLLPPPRIGGGEEEAGMLVLDRKVQEGFWIDGKIFVKVLAVGRKRVKLGIEAPINLEILRGELRAQGEDSPGPNAQPDPEGSLRAARRRS